MQAAILAGGLGTRLGELTKDLPKPMVLVLGKPFLEHLILMLKSKGIGRFVFCTGHLWHKIKEHFGDGSKFGVKIEYSHENKLLYSAGALKNAEHLLDENFFMINGDDYYECDYSALMEFHIKNTSFITIAATNIDYNIINVFATTIIKKDHTIDHYNKDPKNRGNARGTGIFVVSKKVLYDLEKNKPISLEDELIPKYVLQKKIFAKFDKGNYVIDIGTPELYKKFIDDIKIGKVNLFS